MKDPAKALSAAVEKIPGGLRFGPRLMRGGCGARLYRHNCPPRVANFVRRASSGQHEITIRFELDNDIPENTLLAMIGLDDDKPGTSRFAVEVNDKRIFEGPDTFPENNWGPMSVQIPGGLLKKGLNIIKIVNTTHEEVGTSDAAEDYTWGWVGFAEVCLLNPNGGFKTFLKGGKDHGGWFQVKGKTSPPSGKVKVEDGKLHIEGGDDARTGVAFFRRHKFRRIAVPPYRTVSVKVTASGEGTLTIDFLSYAKKHIIGRENMSRSFKLSAEPQTFTHTFRIPDKAIYIVPEIMIDGKSKAAVSSFDMNFEPRPEKPAAAVMPE